MATYNFTVANNSLRVELVITGGDFEPRIDTFKSPSFTLATDRIKFYENGIYKMALSFNEFGTIDGVSPTDLEDALDLLDATTANFNGGGAAPYLVYTAILNQSGTTAPIATILENTTGETPTYGYNNVGEFQINSPGSKYDPDKIRVVLSMPDNNTQISYGVPEGNLIPLFSSSTNGIMVYATIKIEIYP